MEKNSSETKSLDCSDHLDGSKNTQKIIRVKRKRSDTSEESSESTDDCLSPEIKYDGPPVRYKLCYKNGHTEIVKEPCALISINQQFPVHNQNKKQDSSDSEELFSLKKMPPKSKISKETKALLRIRLRRSTEQSNYKIHNDSDHESNTTKHKNENNDPLELKINQEASPRRNERLRNRPKKLGDYECSIFSNLNSPRTRARKTINYNEDHMFSENVKRSGFKNNKRNHNCKQNIEDINGKHPKIVLKESSKVLSDNEEGAESVSNVQFQSIAGTPKRAIKRISRIRFNSDIIDENNSNTSENTLLLSKKTRQSENTGGNNEDKEISNVCNSIVEMSIKKNVLTPRKKNNRQEQEESKNVKNNSGTPKASISRKCNNLTPSMEKRATLLVKPSTPLQQSRSKLHVSVVPKSLPCREEEFNNIFTFLEGKLMDKCGGCIYISGVPGTGKTATVNEVIRCLKRSVAKGKLDDFDFIEINGMKLTEPRQAYVQILKQLSGNTCTWEKAYYELEKRFIYTNSKIPMTLLLVDELDLLCTKRQDVVYNLLDWPTKASAKLVVITIANTMDLPERVLMGRVTSRLGLTRLTFQPYNHKQLQEIVITRLKDTDAFRSEAIQLVARKVSAVSGDARRALDICRRATEIAEMHGKDKVSMDDVNKALLEMIVSSKVQAIKHCSQMEQIFLQAVCAEVTRTGIEESCFKNVYRQLCSMCSFEGIKIPTVTETFAICGRLTALILCALKILCNHSKQYRLFWILPTLDDLNWITEMLKNHKVSGVVSIGCGCGLIEWLLQNFSGLDIIGIELDGSWWRKGQQRSTDPLPFDEKFAKYKWQLLAKRQIMNYRDYITVYSR
ncbi:hypothetical protein KPH14_002656 [Odynerus spinipes]|uniref:Origin recognition complex subunit 1 n=1 Tax=Odynerus spinipes TaxID=1348599 RepID=A0AAD9RGR7_9HYME|nr:hypothetical protein KPH14_002656 [Odynerus spinipes]